MAASIILLTAVAFLSATIAGLIVSAHRTAVRHQHLPWFGASSPTWYNLLIARVKNTFNLKDNYQNLVDLVRSSPIHRIRSGLTGSSIGLRERHVSFPLLLEIWWWSLPQN